MTATAGRAPAGTRVRELARAGIAPLACAVVLIALLAGWVASGGAGTISRVRVDVALAAIPVTTITGTAPAGRPLPAYLIIRNLTGRADQLLSATSPDAASIRLSKPGAAGTFPVPAHGTLTLNPFGPDLVFTGLRALRAGQTVPLTLHFSQAGKVTVQADVTPPGAP